MCNTYSATLFPAPLCPTSYTHKKNSIKKNKIANYLSCECELHCYAKELKFFKV